MKLCIYIMLLALTLAIVAVGQRPRQTPRGKASAAPSSSPTPTPTPTPTPSLDSLEDFGEAKSRAAHSKTLWSLSLNYQSADYPAKTALDLSADLEKPETLDEHKELRPYQEQLKTITLRIGVLGHSLIYFLYGNKAGPYGPFPFRLVRYKGTKGFVAYVASDTVYNTLRLNSAKQRAAKAASSNALPILRELARTLRDTDIDTLAVFVTYGTKDFLDKGASATKAEILAILSSKSDAQAFADGEQSDTEFLRKALILLSDRDANDFNRVELQLD